MIETCQNCEGRGFKGSRMCGLCDGWGFIVDEEEEYYADQAEKTLQQDRLPVAGKAAGKMPSRVPKPSTQHNSRRRPKQTFVSVAARLRAELAKASPGYFSK